MRKITSINSRNFNMYHETQKAISLCSKKFYCTKSTEPKKRLKCQCRHFDNEKVLAHSMKTAIEQIEKQIKMITGEKRMKE